MKARHPVAIIGLTLLALAGLYYGLRDWMGVSLPF
jgi:hypothetical protein